MTPLQQRFRPCVERLEARELLDADAIWPIKPIADDHQMLTGFGDGSPNSLASFHEGIDILVDGQGGQFVRAARAGRLFWNNPNIAGGYIVIEVELPGNQFEYDVYLHVNPDPNLPPRNSQIEQGRGLGNISSFFPAGARHLHFSVVNAPPPENADPEIRSFRNPFLRFASNDDIDPLGLMPSWNFSDEVRNPPANVLRRLTVAPSGTTNPFPNGVVSGEVDIIADVYDQMNTTTQWSWGAAAPHSVGWAVRPLFTGTHGVKSIQQPYLVAEFDDNWFGQIQGSTEALRRGNALEKMRLVYATGLPVWNPLGAPKVLNFIVTNTNGTSGAITNVNERYWKTDALDDGATDDSGHAYYWDMPPTNHNGRARFKDGDYRIHIILTEATGFTRVLSADIRMQNFVRAPRVRPGNNALPAPVGITQPLYDTTIPREFVADFVPLPTEASSSYSSVFGEMVAVGGNGQTGYLDTNYYPNLLMDVYVVPHRIWNEGDSLSAGAVHHSLVQSDSEGTIPLTQVWLSTQIGQFDLIVDYDNDGKFSWKLDGLTAFTVNKAHTYATVGTSPSPSTFGQSVTISAQISVMSPGAGTPTGTVSFFDGSNLLGTTALSPSGFASIAVSTLTVGSHSISAVYSGDANFHPTTGYIFHTVQSGGGGGSGGLISGLAWNDANGNGIQDSGEGVFAGLTVQLFNSSGQLVATATTNTSGSYQFNNVAQGSYYLVFQKPTGYQSTLQDQGSDDTDSDINIDAITALFSIMGSQSLDFDAGFRAI